MRKPMSVSSRATKALFLCLLLVIAGLVLGACSLRQPEDNLNKSSGVAVSEAAPKVSSNAEEIRFDILETWAPKKVIIKTSSIGQSPGMNYTITPKADVRFMALELALTQENHKEPVSANYSNVTLIDSSGGRHKPLFSYPSSLSSDTPNKDALSFTDDPNKLIGGKLSELGSKLILVFETPIKSSGFKIEIGSGAPIDVEVKH